MLPPNVRANLDRLRPVGGDWGFLHVTEESRKRKCRQCGSCCTLFMISGNRRQLEVEALRTKGGRGEDARFALEHWHQLDRNEAQARGIPENDSEYCMSCDRLGEDNLCSDYENRPPGCKAHPGRIGQTVMKNCVFGEETEEEYRARMRDELKKLEKLDVVEVTK